MRRSSLALSTIARATLAVTLSSVLVFQAIAPTVPYLFARGRTISAATGAAITTSFPHLVPGFHGATPSPAIGHAPFRSNLDDVGRLRLRPEPATVAAWQTNSGSGSGSTRLQALVRLGEYSLDRHDPRSSEALFNLAISLAGPRSAEHGAARYGKIMALFHQGRYADADRQVQRLIAHPEAGYDGRFLASFARCVGACADYHRERAEMGLAEPGRIDPLCGVAGVQKCVSALGRDVTMEQAAKTVRHDGYGSDAEEIADGMRELGAVPYALRLDDTGLIRAPKPLVAHVEHDHFVTVTRADRGGVAYWCQDCGGDQFVSWRQWHALEADAYLYAARPGSVEDKALRQLQMTGAQTPEDRYASIGFWSGPPALSKPVQQLVAALQMHATRFIPPSFLTCGWRQVSTLCEDCPVKQLSCPMVGASVNLATGGEEHGPISDLTVYNPTGPSVNWSRYYGSFAFPIENGLGSGWSNMYNLAVKQESYSNNALLATIICPSGAKIAMSYTGSAPTQGTPSVQLQVADGFPVLAYWKWSSAGLYYELVLRDRTKLTMGQATTVPYPHGANVSRLALLADRNGNQLQFSYTTYGSQHGNVGMLTSISNGSTTLLSLNYDSSTGALTSVADCYGRSVQYSTQAIACENIPSYAPQSYLELTGASQIVSTGTSSPPVAWQYEYTNVGNGESGVNGLPQKIPLMYKMKSPSPTGTGLSTTTLHYVAPGYVDKETDPSGNYFLVTAEDLATSRVVWKDAANNTLRDILYDFNTTMSTVRVYADAPGNHVAHDFVHYTYAGADPYRPSTVSLPPKTGSTTRRDYALTYDAFGNVLTVTTPKSTVTTNSYSYSNWPLGEVTATQVAPSSGSAKTSTTFAYYSNGLLNTVNTPIPGELHTGNRQTTTYTYTSLGNLASVTSPGNNATSTHTTTYGYTTDGSYSQSEALGQPITVTDTLGKATHLRYDSRGNLTSVKDALGNETTATYNLADQELTSVLPATGNTGSGHAYTSNIYLWVGGPASQVKAYDESNTLTRTVDFDYGAAGELLSRSGSAESVDMTYDGLYHTKTLDDGNSNQTVYDYDSLGRLSKISYPGAGSGTADTVEFTSYDDAGNVLQRIDGNGAYTDYTYGDADGLLSAVSYSGASSQDVAITYDDFDRPVSVTDGTGSASTDYDDVDLVSSASRTYTGLSAKTFDYLYWPDGSRKQMDTPVGPFTYQYDADGRFNYASANYVGRVTCSYLDNGWMDSRTLVSSTFLKTEYAYNNAGMLSSVTNKLNGTAQSTYNAFGYDGVFNLTGHTASLPSYSGSTTWSYDTKDRLTGESSSKNGGYSESFAYDSAGNPTTFIGSTRTYNSNNQRTSSGSFAYDGNGNPTTYTASAFGTQSCTYDRENRLTAIGSGWTAGYRADGLRAWKQVGSTRTYYYYDNGNPILEYTSGDTVQAINGYAPDGLYARWTGSGATYYTFDQQGSVAQRFDANGNVLASSMNDAYGNEAVTSSQSDPFSYNAKWGYQLDRESGLYLCQHRFYDPGTGRWLTRDPLSNLALDLTVGWNQYGYCGAKPINDSDSSGLASIVQVGEGFLGIGYSHRYIALDAPCTDPRTGPQTSFGFWPEFGNGSSMAYSGGCELRAPDTRAGLFDEESRPLAKKNYVTDTNPAFERALCQCIQAWLRNRLPNSGYILGFYACGSWAAEMWRCAEAMTYGAGPPSRAPGDTANAGALMPGESFWRGGHQIWK